jgi:hypothetical protein
MKGIGLEKKVPRKKADEGEGKGECAQEVRVVRGMPGKRERLYQIVLPLSVDTSTCWHWQTPPAWQDHDRYRSFAVQESGGVDRSQIWPAALLGCRQCSWKYDSG